MPTIKGSEIQQLGQDTVARAIAKAERTSIAKAKDKLSKAKAKYMEQLQLNPKGGYYEEG